jgi:hypothetical protein
MYAQIGTASRRGAIRNASESHERGHSPPRIGEKVATGSLEQPRPSRCGSLGLTPLVVTADNAMMSKGSAVGTK